MISSEKIKEIIEKRPDLIPYLSNEKEFMKHLSDK